MVQAHPFSITPPRPRLGSKVAIVSPSAPGVALFPHRRQRGMAYLRGLGLEPVLMPNAAARDRWVVGSPRADDLHRAFADPEVSVVLCAIGGNQTG
jgi:muramoyltetrapeptide carboxypeptidase LdcA involved in peptidoglycan recycling